MKRWPTMPVAPRMPIGCLVCMVVNTPVYRRIGSALQNGVAAGVSFQVAPQANVFGRAALRVHLDPPAWHPTMPGVL